MQKVTSARLQLVPQQHGLSHFPSRFAFYVPGHKCISDGHLIDTLRAPLEIPPISPSSQAMTGCDNAAPSLQ